MAAAAPAEAPSPCGSAAAGQSGAGRRREGRNGRADLGRLPGAPHGERSVLSALGRF